MNTYKVTFKFASLKLNIEVTCVHVVVEATTEKEAVLIARELLNPGIKANIRRASALKT